MKKYKNIFINYIKEHQNEIKYSGEHYADFGSIYVFKLRCPKKFLNIFPINYRFIVYDRPDNDIITKYYLIDIDTIFHKGIRLNYNEDKELILFLANKFKILYRNYLKVKYEKRLKAMVNNIDK